MDLMFILIFILLKKLTSATDGINHLTENFFANLRANIEENGSQYDFIDRQVDNYINLIQHSYNYKESLKWKRDLNEWKKTPKQNYAVHRLTGLIPINTITSNSAKDAMLFAQNNGIGEQWYSVILEGGRNGSLSVYKYNGSDFVKINTKFVKNGVRLGLHSIQNATFIVVAENTTSLSNFANKSAIYLFKNDEELYKIQNLDVDYASDVSIWGDKGDIFMAVSKEMSNNTGKITYEVESTIYKWLGEHFDIIQKLNTSAASKVIPFVIGKNHFLAFANKRDNSGESNIYSEIFKFDLNSEKFISYQKILTQGASDLKFFCFKSGVIRENFLAIANSYSIDSNKQIYYATNSIIYKFVDDYFIPFQNFELNGITEWLPIVGLNGEFALLAACKFDPLKFFQYDGWRFVETNIVVDEAIGVEGMNSLIFQNKAIVVIANGNVNLYEFAFKEENNLNQYFNDMLVWCRQSIIELESNKTRSKRNLQQIQNPLIQNMQDQLLLQINELDQLENKLKEMQELIIIQGDLNAENLIFNSESFFERLTTEQLNDINVFETLTNVININEPQNLDKLTIKSVKINNKINPKLVNNIDNENILHQNLILDDLIIKGNVVFDKIKTKFINSVNFSKESILLKTEDQDLSGSLNLGKLEISKARTLYLNKLILSNLPITKTIKISNIDKINIKNIVVGGYINNIDVPTLKKYSLKKFGNQEIISTYIFDELKVNNFNSNQLNDKIIPDDLIRIDEGEFTIDQDVQFEDLISNELEIQNRINQIRVVDGKLDVLLVNVSENQNIEGLKRFENLNIIGPIQVRGKFDSHYLDLMNPVTTIEEELHVLGDYVISGRVMVEEIVKAENYVSGDLSIGRLLEKGLKITDGNTDVRLNFEQPLDLNEIYVDKINNVSPQQWVVNGGDERQYIKGWKTFDGNLYITGPTQLGTVNNINLPDMEENILKTDGDQVITGKHFINNVNTGSLESSTIKFGPHPWESLLTNNITQTITGTANLKSLTSTSIKSNTLQITGTINNIKFDDIIEDTVFKNSSGRLLGHKHFENLQVDTLTSRSSININKIPNLIKKEQAMITVQNYMILPDNISIGKIDFVDKINGMGAMDFDMNWLNLGVDQSIVGDQYFDKLILHGNGFIGSNKINGVDLSSIQEDTVKIDEEFDFGAVNFKSPLISLDMIKLNGHIEGVDINNILSITEEEIIFPDSITFKDDVSIDGQLYVNGIINGVVNLTKLCFFTENNLEESDKNLIITGNATFVKGPIIKTINDQSISEILETAWMANKATTFEGHAHFNDVIFEDDLEVEGFFDDVHLDLFRDNYFSKSKNQTIAANLYFQEGIGLVDIIADEAIVKGDLCGINLAKFINTAILQGVDQVFENVLFVEQITINEMDGNYLVNKQNLLTDVMTYDGENIVAGKKTIENINAANLRIDDKNIKVQNVDLTNWIQKAILITGRHTIDGKISLDNTTSFENGISLKGLLNEAPFNEKTVMLKSVPQAIEQKTFFSKTENPIVFKEVKLGGRINNADLLQFIQNQVFASEDTSISTQVKFNANINADNINFESLYQGVNISQLLTNLTNFVSLNNYFASYKNLLEVATNVNASLSQQAHFLHYFKPVQGIVAKYLFPIQRYHNGLYLAAYQEINGTGVIDFYKWDQENGIFDIDSDLYRMNFKTYLSYVAPLEFAEESLLYTEQIHSDGSTWANIISRIDQEPFERIAVIPTSGTKLVQAFKLPIIKTECLLMTQNADNYIYIFCFMEKLKLHQKLPSVDPSMIKIINVEDFSYIIAVNKGGPNMEPCVTIWKYDHNTMLFNEHQHIYTASPNSIATITHNGIHYLAIGSGYLSNTLYPGQILIKRFDKKSQHFSEWQQFRVYAPVQVEFAVLPSNEFLLYILCDSPTEPLIIYKYEGISKFTEHSNISVPTKSVALTQFTHGDQHFLLTSCDSTYTIISAVFKGF